jgi:DnaJ-class molecular chaperone
MDLCMADDDDSTIAIPNDTCTMCGGSGEANDGTECPLCKGSGTIDVSLPDGS